MNSGQTPPPVPQDAASQVVGPATALLITGIVGGILDISFFLVNLIGTGIGSLFTRDLSRRYLGLYEGAAAASLALVGLFVAAFVIYASLQMKQLKQWPLSIAASVLAMIPCVSPCCIIGLPVGIWCLVVLNKPEVKTAFR